VKTRQTPDGNVFELSMTDQEIGAVNRVKQVRIDGKLDALLSRPLAVDIVGSSGALMALVKMGHIRVVQSSDGQGFMLYVRSDCQKYAQHLAKK
jgi:hypothetical protein